MKKIYILVIAMLVLALTGCTKNVTDEPISINFQGKSYEGKYTGVLDNGVPTGQGTFNYQSSELNFNFVGGFENEELKGEGTLDTNFYTVDFKDVSRTGEYSGQVVDGGAKGTGTFTAINDDNEKYTYEGEWDNGLYNGNGRSYFDNKDYAPMEQIGNFTDGEFTPSAKDCYYSLATETSKPYTLPEKSKKFLEEHEALFPTDSYEKISEYVDSSVEYKQLNKSVSSYGDKMIEANCVITQILNWIFLVKFYHLFLYRMTTEIIICCII